ncbi:MAG: RagB/SusD family nutrient uptake outer membrane protein [Bacteroidales bacterium]|nr:RagB/SusD family nutrient uptake outer membrane protein [Bacteroidales bacterium]
MKRSIILFISIFTLFSCSDDLLDVYNPNVPTKETFWKSTDDLQLALTATYSQFTRPGNWGRWIYFRYDLTSDEGYSNSPWTELKNWTQFLYTNYNFIQGGLLVYKSHYKQIFYCNQIIAYAQNIVPKNDQDSVLKSQIIGQAKFIRAFDYFNLLIMFGKLEIVLEPSKTSDVYPAGGEAEIYPIIIADLEDAIKRLPATWKGNDVGRITKGAAYALLGKVYMQMHEWQKAKDAFYWLVEGDGAQYYDLMPNYKDNFTHYKENNKESVFEIQFSDANQTVTDQNNGTDIDDDIPLMNVGSSRSQFFAPKGIGWCDGQPRSWLVDEYKKERTTHDSIDRRLITSIFYPDMFTDFPGETVWGNKKYKSAWGKECFVRKYGDDYFKKTSDYYSPINYRVIRYADVLLCYAECLANLGDVATAVTYVDRVRARADLSKLSESQVPEIAQSANDKDKFLKRLQMERALELCFESVRWIDLKRWGLLETEEGINELKQRDPDFNNFIIGKHSVMPLPQVEVDNNPNLTQNPNY